MSKKSFQIRRAPNCPSDVPHKSFELHSRANRYPSPNGLNLVDNKVIVDKLQKQVPLEDNKKGSKPDNSLSVPRSAPLNKSKRAARIKESSKDPNELSKKYNSATNAEHSPENRGSDHLKGYGNSKVVEVFTEVHRKYSSEKSVVLRPSIAKSNINHADKRNESPSVGEANRSISKTEKQTSPEPELRLNEPNNVKGNREGSPNCFEFTLSSFYPGHNNIEPEKKEGQLKGDGEKKNENKGNKESGTENKKSKTTVLDDNFPIQKPTAHKRSTKKDHYSISEFQKQNDQRKLMNFLDSQMEEKSKKQEGEEKKDPEISQKRQEKSHKQLKFHPQWLDKEAVFDLKVKLRPKTNEVKGRGSPLKSLGREMMEKIIKRSNLNSIVSNITPEPGYKTFINDKTEFQSQKDVENFNGGREHSGEPIVVQKLVEENKHLRDENIKKKEIIDILMSVLKKQRNSNGTMLGEQFKRTSPLVMNHPWNLSVNLVERKNSDAEFFSETKSIKERGIYDPHLINNPFCPKNDTSFEDKVVRPVQLRQVETHKHSGHQPGEIKSPLIPDPDGTPDLTKYSKAVTPLRNDLNKMLLPLHRDIESSVSHFRGTSSPIVLQPGAYSSGAGTFGYSREAKRAGHKSKTSFLPLLHESPSGQLHQRSSVVASIDAGASGLNNMDSLKVLENSFKKEDYVPRDAEQPQIRFSYSDMSLLKGDYGMKLLHSEIKKKKLYDAIYNPMNIKPAAHSHPNVPKERKYSHGEMRSINGTPMKTDNSGQVMEEKGAKVVSQTENFREQNPLLLRNAKSQGTLVGLSSIRIVDTVNYGKKDVNSINSNTGFIKVYTKDAGGGISDRGTSSQNNNGKKKFPKEVFTVNVKKKLC